MKQALGLVEIQGLSTAVVVADTMAKAANIQILEIENTKGLGYMTIKIAGDVGAVNAAVNAGRQIGIANQKLVSWKVIPRPSDYVEHTFCNPTPPGGGAPSGKEEADSCRDKEETEEKAQLKAQPEGAVMPETGNAELDSAPEEAAANPKSAGTEPEPETVEAKAAANPKAAGTEPEPETVEAKAAVNPKAAGTEPEPETVEAKAAANPKAAGTEPEPETVEAKAAANPKAARTEPETELKAEADPKAVEAEAKPVTVEAKAVAKPKAADAEAKPETTDTKAEPNTVASNIAEVEAKVKLDPEAAGPETAADPDTAGVKAKPKPNAAQTKAEAKQEEIEAETASEAVSSPVPDAVPKKKASSSAKNGPASKKSVGTRRKNKGDSNTI